MMDVSYEYIDTVVLDASFHSHSFDDYRNSSFDVSDEEVINAFKYHSDSSLSLSSCENVSEKNNTQRKTSDDYIKKPYLFERLRPLQHKRRKRDASIIIEGKYETLDNRTPTPPIFNALKQLFFGSKN
jgi:hypothetical protein